MTAGGEAHRRLRFTPSFLAALTGRNFSVAERRAFITTLGLLDSDESHPSLRVHELRGPLSGTWSVSGSRSLRMTFIRGRDDLKVMLTCSHHSQK